MSDEGTPPHHPTYAVNLTDTQIEAVLPATFQSVTISSIRQLQSGQSFNNRIYFVTAVVNDTVQEFALKVSGHFFDGRKVENEVACLLMLRHYCLDVPVASVFAWSVDGGTCESSPEVESVDGRVGVRTVTTCIDDSQRQARSWILMQKLPGDRMDTSDGSIGESEFVVLMKQLARCTNAWRSKVPRQRGFGNVRMRKHPSSMDGRSLFCFEVAGLIICKHLNQDCVIPTKIDYFLQRVENAMKALDTNPCFPSTYRQRVKQLVGDNLGNGYLNNMEALMSKSHLHPVFTHYDFAPRNMLVGRDPITNRLQVTGILDFEFAGFFPVEEEFLNNTIGNEGDWPLNLYQAYLDELEGLACEVPQISYKYRVHDNDTMQQNEGTRNVFPEQLWNTAVLVTKTINDIAPWQVGTGTYYGEELDYELSQAAMRLKDSVAKLCEKG